MARILVDTSVWIDFFNAQRTTEAEKLETLLRLDAPICICPAILQEVLQGLKGAFVDRTTKLLLLQEILTDDAVEAAIGAATLYRALREKGITIRSGNDCLIAYRAIYHNAQLLQKDRDFQSIAAHTELKLF